MTLRSPRGRLSEGVTLIMLIIPPMHRSGVILDRVSFHGRFVHIHLPSFPYGMHRTTARCIYRYIARQERVNNNPSTSPKAGARVRPHRSTPKNNSRSKQPRSQQQPRQPKTQELLTDAWGIRLPQISKPSGGPRVTKQRGAARDEDAPT